MGRASLYSEEQMLDAAASLLVEGGLPALSASGVARSLSAPSGSVYHRFASRDHLAAALWMRTVERFDAEVVAGILEPGDPLEVAVAAARQLVEWSDRNPTDAFVLTMFRRQDLVTGAVPADLSSRARRLGRRQKAAIDQLADRLDRPVQLVTFAVAGIPHAAVRPHVGARRPVPSGTADAVERATRAVLTDPSDDESE